MVIINNKVVTKILDSYRVLVSKCSTILKNPRNKAILRTLLFHVFHVYISCYVLLHILNLLQGFTRAAAGKYIKKYIINVY